MFLTRAACEKCNSKIVNPWDIFLATKLSPTHMARAELDLRSYSGKQPKMEIRGVDPVLGEIPMIMQKGSKGTEIVPKLAPKGEGGRLWVTPASTLDEAIAMVSRAMRRPISREEISEWGRVHAGKFLVKKPDWKRGHKAVAKIFYAYLLLELGERILFAPPMEQLRRYFLEESPEVQMDPIVEVGELFDVPAHHHVLTFDSQDPSWNAICLFRAFWFKYPIDLSALPPSGRLIAVNAESSDIVEPLTKWKGAWHPRTSIKWGWTR